MPNDVKQLLEGLGKLVSQDDLKKFAEETRTVITNALEAINRKVDDKLASTEQAASDARAAVEQATSDLSQIVQETRDANTTTLASLRQRTLEALDSYFTKLRLEDRFNKTLDSLTSTVQGKIDALDAKIATVPQVDVKQLALDAALLVPQVTPVDLTPLNEAIDEFRKEMETLKKRSGGTNFVVSRGAVRLYDLSASLNGVTKTFALPAFWRVIDVQSSSTPNAFRPTVDYTTDAAASTISFTNQIDAASTLNTGQTLTVIYAEG